MTLSNPRALLYVALGQNLHNEASRAFERYIEDMDGDVSNGCRS